MLPEKCCHRLVMEVERRPGNALNLEIGAPMPRCKLKPPANWGGRDMVARWLFSGGSPLVFGVCMACCPLVQEVPR